MGQTWEADKMLDVYIYDYLVKRNLQETAKTFMAEGKVATGPVAIDAPGGFLFEWWSVFWDIFITRTNENHSEAAAAYFEVQQMKNKEQIIMQYQLMQRQAAINQLRNANRPAPNGAISDGILGSAAASPLAANVYSEHLKNPNSINSEATKSIGSHPGQLVQGHAGNMSSALHQIQGRNQQSTDIRPGPGVSPRSLPGDSSTLYGQRIGQGKTGFSGSAVLNQGAGGSAMLDGWPLTNEQLRSNLGQVQRPFLPSSSQYQVLSAEQLLTQAHVQGNVGNSHGFGAMDPQRIRALQRAGLNMKDGQPNGNDGQLGSPLQTSSPMLRMAQMQQSMAQKPPDQMIHQLQQNNRKRKPSSSGAANSSGLSSSQPSTPSNNTQGDGVATVGDVPHASSMQKSSMMYGADGARALGSSSNQMDDLENLGDIGALDDQMDSFFAQDGDGRDLFAQNSPAENNANASKEHGGEQSHGHPRT